MTETAALSRDAEAVTSRAAGPCFEVYDAEFEVVLGRYARLALVAETDAHEGPVYIPGEDALYFTTVPRAPSIPAGAPRAAIKRLALDGLSLPVDPSRLSTVPAPVHMPNGMTLGHDGRLVVCEQVSPRGEHLGTVRLPESPHNLAWGDEDARTLYITALTSIYRIRLAIPGVRPH
jgi:sugar lactone lactonase YvrE